MSTLFELISVACLLDSLDHVFNDLLGITKDHHSFVQIEKFIVWTSKNIDLGRYKIEQEKLNLLG